MSCVDVRAEWEPHKATWIQWPHGEERSLEPVFGELVRHLRGRELVNVVVSPGVNPRDLERRICGAGVRLIVAPTDWCWCRDNGPIIVSGRDHHRVVDWAFDAWGAPWLAHRRDDAVPRVVARVLGLPVDRRRPVIEGGALEWNGGDLLLASRTCIRRRNRRWSLRALETELRSALGVRRVIWLDGYPREDTMTLGHVDGVARFVDRRTVVVGAVSDPRHPDHAFYEGVAHGLSCCGLDVIRMELGGRAGVRLGYLNWYVANGAVLVGTFGSRRDDDRALEQVGVLFPGRKVLGLDARPLWRRGGGIHCVTMQEPA